MAGAIVSGRAFVVRSRRDVSLPPGILSAESLTS